MEVHDRVAFHGGTGSTLEMLQFSAAGLKNKLMAEIRAVSAEAGRTRSG